MKYLLGNLHFWNSLSNLWFRMSLWLSHVFGRVVFPIFHPGVWGFTMSWHIWDWRSVNSFWTRESPWNEERTWRAKSLLCAQERNCATCYSNRWMYPSCTLSIMLTGSSQNSNEINLKSTVYITDLSDLECVFKLQFIMNKLILGSYVTH